MVRVTLPGISIDVQRSRFDIASSRDTSESTHEGQVHKRTSNDTVPSPFVSNSLNMNCARSASVVPQSIVKPDASSLKSTEPLRSESNALNSSACKRNETKCSRERAGSENHKVTSEAP